MSIALAKEIATRAHAGQKRWGGEPYITHPDNVAHYVKQFRDEYIIVAWLHDVVEDTTVTLDDLRKDFSDEVVNAVDAITKRDYETYARYIERVAENDIAREVKIADIKHNLQSLKKGSMKDKYVLALLYFNLYEQYQSLEAFYTTGANGE